MPKRFSLLLNLPVYFFCGLVLLPILFTLGSWFWVDSDIWQHLWETQMSTLILNTLLLVFGVGVGVTLLGVPLAWLTAVCDFPGRKLFEWALILPLAIPAYVMGFIVLGIFDFGGPAQTMLQSLGMTRHLEVRTGFSVIVVMSIVLFPYVYLLARAAFLAQGTSLIEISQTLGMKPRRAFFRVALPAARPAIVAGVSLALMETLADFGTVSIFGYDTFTTAIYKSWFSLFSIETAAQLASLLLLFVICALFLERSLRPKTPKDSPSKTTRNRILLSGAKAFGASAFCMFLILATVIMPMTQLIAWSLDNFSYLTDSRFFPILLRTLSLAAMAALMVILIAIPFAISSKTHATTTLTSEIAGLGYAIPGSILAVGIMFAFALGDRILVSTATVLGFEVEPLLLGSLAGLLLAYVIRYFRPGFGALATSIQRIRPSYLESARLLGVSNIQATMRISLPLLLPGMFTGALIVFVDVVKEMPASLLLRPFGWDTLAIKIYELTSEGEWERAGIFALVLVLLSAIPVMLLIQQSRQAADH